MEIIVAENTKYEVNLTAICCGEDLSVTITGGTKAHVGAVALGCSRMPDGRKLKYSASVSSLVVLDHKDDYVARKVAGLLADEWGGNVSVTAGIHIDDATKEELILLQDNVMKACDQLIQIYRSDKRE